MASKVSTVPHSWAITNWPETIYPHSASRGKYIVRAFRDQLVAAGALTRIGRDLVVLGSGYSAWLSKQSGKVAGFEIAPNRATGGVETA
jgi:hypothetical protein